MEKFLLLVGNEKGATAIEYALIASLISIAAVLAMGSVGSSVSGSFSNVAANLGR